MITIRRAKQEDWKAVLGLATQFATSFAVEPDTFARTFSELLPSPGAYLAVAESENVVIGYVLGFVHLTFYANGPVGWVEEITVHADYRRHGIGSALMNGFEEWTKQRECRLVALATRRAAAFYTALGYEESASYFRRLL